MALPQFKVAGALAVATSGTTLTTTIPTGTAAGDGMVLAVMHNGASGFTTPSGWNLIGAVVNNTNQSSAFFERKFVAGDANPATTTATMSTTSAGYGRIIVFRNVDASATWFEAATANVASGTPTTSTTPTSSGITTTGADRLDVALVSGDDDPAFTSGMPPAGWAQIGSVSTTTGGDALFDGIWRPHFSAGTQAAVTIGTWAARYWRTLSLGVLPGTGLSVRHYQAAASTTTPKATGTIEWAAGDTFFVVGSMENNTLLLDTPTATGLTFTSTGTAGPVDSPVDTGPGIQTWTAVAGSAGSSTISMTRNAASINQNYGFQVWVFSGAGTLQTPVINLTEAAFSVTPAAGSIVVYEMIDWNAVAAGKAITAGTGYGNERTDVLNTGYSVVSADWTDVTATTANYGLASYTGLNVAHVVAEFRPSTGPPTVTGVALADLGALTATAAGVVDVPATAALSSSLAATALGVRSFNGTALANLGGLTATVAGVRSFNGAALADLGGLAATAAATVTVPATALADLGALTATALGTVTGGAGAVTGVALADLGGLTATAAGAVTVPATAAASSSLTATALGVVTVPATAALASSLTATAAGVVTVPATALADLGALTALGTGLRAVSGQGAANLGTLAATAAGVVDVPGTAAGNLGALTATALGTVTGPGAVTAVANFGALTATATGLRGVSGQGTANLGTLAATGAGVRTVIATSSATFGGLGATVAGVRLVVSTAAATLGPLSATAVGQRAVTGTALANLGIFTATAVGTTVVGGSQPGDVHAAIAGPAATATVGGPYAVAELAGGQATARIAKA